MLVLTCPSPREVTDFRFGGEAERDTRTNDVLFTALPGDVE